MSRAKKIAAAALTSAMMLTMMASPALAIGDKFVPANTCSGENPNAVGTPGGNPNPGLVVSEPVGALTSDTNSRLSPGAKADANPNAELHCKTTTSL